MHKLISQVPGQENAAPVRTKVLSEEFYKGLDPGIRFAIRVLHASGIETRQSCQGGAGHSYPEPTVDLPTGANDWWGFEALSCLRDYCLPVSTVGIIWNVSLGRPFENLWRITFSGNMEDLADQKPNFVWGYRAQ